MSTASASLAWLTTLHRAKALGLANLRFQEGDATQLSGLADQSFDLVVSNPPYVAADDPHLSAGDLRFEPRGALVGGADGLDHYRLLAPEILRVLKPGGRFLVEIGHDQSSAVEPLFRDAGAIEVATLKDLSDRHRVVWGRKKPLET